MLADIATRADALGTLLCCSLLSALPGCGSLAGPDYRGEVLLELTGQVLYDGSLPFESEIGVTLLWSLDLEEAADQQAVVAKTEFPSRYTLSLYHPPSAPSYQPLFGESWLRAAVGQPVLYEDSDEDGVWDQQTERVVGGAFNRAIVWIERLGATPETIGGWVPERAGFHVVDVTRLPCIDTSVSELPISKATGQTDLEIGYNWLANNDWDCDGNEDWDPEETLPDPISECADPAQYEPICEDARASAGAGSGLEYLAMLLADPILFECMWMTCPDAIDMLTTMGGDSCPDPVTSESFCLQMETSGADPVLGPAMRDQLAFIPGLEGCLRPLCGPVIDWLYGEPWVD